MTTSHPIDTISNCTALISFAEEILVKLNQNGDPKSAPLRMYVLDYITIQDIKCREARQILGSDYIEGEIQLTAKRQRGILSVGDFWREWILLWIES